MECRIGTIEIRKKDELIGIYDIIKINADADLDVFKFKFKVCIPNKSERFLIEIGTNINFVINSDVIISEDAFVYKYVFEKEFLYLYGEEYSLGAMFANQIMRTLKSNSMTRVLFFRHKS